MPRSDFRARAHGAATTVQELRCRRTVRALAVASACALSSVALPIAPAAADDFSDFRIPSNRGLLWTAALNALAANQKNTGLGDEISSGNSNGTVSSKFSWFSDSDPALTALDVSFAVLGNHGHVSAEFQSVVPPSSTLSVNERDDRSLREGVSLSAAHRHYPWATPVGFEAALSASGSFAQDWGNQSNDALFVNPGLTSQTTQTTYSETWRYNYTFVAAATLGWGRVRNATGIYDALVLERRLIETGALSRPLSPEARRRLADVLYLRGSLDEIRERPGRVLWQEIERVLADDGALREGGLDPYSVLRATEPHLGAAPGLTADGVPVSPVSRLTGAFVGIRVQDVSANRIDRNDSGSSFQTIQNGIVISSGSSTSSSRFTSTFDRVDAGPAGDFHLPIGPPWQLDGSGSVLLAVRKEDSYMVSQAQLSMTWLAADRWTANGSVDYSGIDDDRTNGPTAGDAWNWRVAFRVSWYVEDHTAISLSALQFQDWARSDAGTQFARGLSGSLGLTYRFSGWFATPGFFPATAPAPLVPSSGP
jgi:hypothetical protein